MSYPEWIYFPNYADPPAWVHGVVGAFEDRREAIDSRRHKGIKSDDALEEVRSGLERLGFVVETGKKAHQKIKRPVLFTEGGKAQVSYEVDAFLESDGVVVEIEAGRGAANNADYRDLVRASLMLDAKYLVLAMMLSYKAGKAAPVKSYRRTYDRLDAIFKSDRLRLPLDGILLLGY